MCDNDMLQIVPFLALGLGVDDLFLLTHTYSDQDEGQGGSHNQYQSNVSILLRILSISAYK